MLSFGYSYSFDSVFMLIHIPVSITLDKRAFAIFTQTREEKKLEAILKTIERMEKREERKKEALARLEQTKKHSGKDADVDTCQINTTEIIVENIEQKIAVEVLLVIKWCLDNIGSTIQSRKCFFID